MLLLHGAHDEDGLDVLIEDEGVVTDGLGYTLSLHQLTALLVLRLHFGLYKEFYSDKINLWVLALGAR